jgi:predicted nucleic acid-binding protein
VKAYLDTNVLVAASVENHPHHVPAFDLVKAVKEGALQGCISTHGLAEYYSVITRAPFAPQVHPTEAGRFLDENVLPYFELLAISVDDYKAVLKSCSAAGLIGGVVYDALHMHVAENAGCERMYTFNVRDFRALASPTMAGKIAAP